MENPKKIPRLLRVAILSAQVDCNGRRPFPDAPPTTRVPHPFAVLPFAKAWAIPPFTRSNHQSTLNHHPKPRMQLPRPQMRDAHHPSFPPSHNPPEPRHPRRASIAAPKAPARCGFRSVQFRHHLAKDRHALRKANTSTPNPAKHRRPSRPNSYSRSPRCLG